MQLLQQVFAVRNAKQCGQIILLCWGLWFRRNTWVWDRRGMTIFGVKTMVNHMFQEWQRVQVDPKTDKGKLQSTKWWKPPAGWSKINVDASYQSGATHIGAGCIIRDDQGRFIRARATRIHGGVSTREAEALSFKEALTWTKNWRKCRCIFELDAKMVVDVVNGASKNSIFHGIIDECKEILKHFEGVLMGFAHRLL